MFQVGSTVEEISSFITSKLETAKLSQKLTIIDPYALAYDRYNPKHLKELKDPSMILMKILEPFKGKFQTLEFVIGSKNSTNRPEQHMDVLKNQLHIEVKVLRAPSFHDRFWIVDDRLAFIVGTSLNSFGHKHFFIQNAFLNSDDTQLLLHLYRKDSFQ